MPATRKVHCRRNKKQHGGGLGGVVTFAPASHTMNNPLAVATTSSCLSSTRPGTIASYSANGLPGMSGGRRTRRQSGGRYGFVSPNGAAVSGPPSMGGLAPMSRIPCEAATPNPLNPTQLGGGAPPLTGMSLGGDNQAYYAPTAGYSNQASTWVGSTGAPSMIQTPYEAKSMNPACLKTGGGRTRRASKKSRKSKSRKSHKSRR